jgi:hypothetical protein
MFRYVFVRFISWDQFEFDWPPVAGIRLLEDWSAGGNHQLVHVSKVMDCWLIGSFALSEADESGRNSA